MALQNTTNPQKDYPFAALNEIAQVDIGGWVTTTWKEVIAATPSAWVLTGVQVTPGSLGDFAVDVGVGALGAEVVIATLAGFIFGGDWLQCPIPVDAIPLGSRVVVRQRVAYVFGGNTTYFALTYYDKPLVGVVATTTAVLLVHPTGPSGTAVSSGSTAWANTPTWTQLIASTTGGWTIGAVVIAPVFNLPFTGDLWYELDIGVGVLGSEVAVTTIRGSDDYNNAQTRVFRLWPILTGIASGVRVSLRLRSARTFPFNMQVKVLYYISIPAGDIADISTTQPGLCVPSAANSLVLTKPGGAWSVSPWVPFIASTPSDLAVTYLVADLNNGNVENEVDIGVNEVVKATLRWSTNIAGARGIGMWYLTLPIALDVPAGSSLSLRVRNASGSAQSVRFVIGYIANPTFIQRVPSDLRTYVAGTDGPKLSMPGSSWTDSGWGELTPSTESDILVTGLALGPNLSVRWRADLGVGILGSEVVVTTLRGRVSTYPLAWWPLSVPLFLPVGTRLSIRIRQESISQFRRMGLTYYGFLSPPPPIPPSACAVGVSPGCAPQRGAPRIGV